MQWAKLPRPTTKVSIQITATEPVIECDPETSHAAVAMIHPPMTPDQKMVAAGLWIASWPSTASEFSTSGFRAGVSAARAAKANAPRTFDGSTTPQSRIVFQRCLRSDNTSATGYRVFSVKSCDRPMMTTMKPMG